MIDDCSLCEVPFEGNIYTWVSSTCRGRMEQRLDRAPRNMAFSSAWPVQKVIVSPCVCSDHRALVFSGSTGVICPYGMSTLVSVKWLLIAGFLFLLGTVL